VKVIVVTGKGDTFCSGGDIRDMAEGRLKSWDMKRYLWDGVHRIALALEDLDKPVIAAINGAAAGVGVVSAAGAISATLSSGAGIAGAIWRPLAWVGRVRNATSLPGPRDVALAILAGAAGSGLGTSAVGATGAATGAASGSGDGASVGADVTTGAVAACGGADGAGRRLAAADAVRSS